MASIIKANQLQDFGGNSILTSDGSGVVTPNASGIKNTPAFEAFLSSSQTVTDNVTTKIQFNSEVFDTNSCYDNSTNYRFTPTVAGKYFVFSTLGSDTVSGANLDQISLFIYKNGSSISQSKIDARGNTLGSFCTVNATMIVDMNGSSDYLEAFGQIDDTSGNPDFLGINRITNFGAYKIIGA